MKPLRVDLRKIAPREWEARSGEHVRRGLGPKSAERALLEHLRELEERKAKAS